MRTDTPPFDNNDVRLALKYAVDRQQLIDKILRGRGKLGNDHPIGRSNRFYAAQLPQRVYDPDKAKFHLKKAGIEIEVVPEPDDGYWGNVWMKRPWCMSHWSGRATEDWMFSTAYAEGASWNDSFWQHERFNRLLKEAPAELDEGSAARCMSKGTTTPSLLPPLG
jgi:peptide/nickel transport system substrate-binding protein